GERLGGLTPERRRVGNTAAAATAAESSAATGRRRLIRIRRVGLPNSATRIEDLERHGRVAPDVVVDRGAVSRIERLRLVFLERRAVVAPLVVDRGVGRLEEMRRRLDDGLVHLSQRTDVV